jgi:hypothetical protein
MKPLAFMNPPSFILALLLPLASLLAGPVRDSEDPLNPDPESLGTEVTFLGLLATELSPVVSRQLGLSGNLYLSVAMVSPDGPSEKAGLRQYDILKMLDDQILVNPEQLVELVRSRKAGQEVSLSILRGGKEKTLKVKLGSRKSSKLQAQGHANFQIIGNDLLGGRAAFPDDRALEERIRRQIERQTRAFGQRGRNIAPVSPEIIEKFDADGDGKLSPLERDKATDEGAILGKALDFGINLDFGPGPNFQKMIKDARKRGGTSSWSSVSGTAKTKIVNSDADGTYEFISEDGEKQFKVTSADGEVLFDGPVNTDGDRAAMPEHLRDRLETLEGSVRIRIDQSLPGSKKENQKKKDGRAR